MARGKAGGDATRQKFGSEHFRELGRAGGNATKAKHGREHFQRAGRAGYQAQLEKYFKGDREAQREWFITAGLAAQDPMPGNGAFASARPFPSPGAMTWEEWETIWEKHFREGPGWTGGAG